MWFCKHKWKIIKETQLDLGTIQKTELTLQCENCGKIKYSRPSSYV